MENWIGIGVWIIMGGLIGLLMKAIIKRPEATPGHTAILVVLGAFAAVVGGVLNVRINLRSIDDQAFVDQMEGECREIEGKAKGLLDETMEVVNRRIGEL